MTLFLTVLLLFVVGWACWWLGREYGRAEGLAERWNEEARRERRSDA